jgi:hypothetical protein
MSNRGLLQKVVATGAEHWAVHMPALICSATLHSNEQSGTDGKRIGFDAVLSSNAEFGQVVDHANVSGLDESSGPRDLAPVN